MQYNNGNLIQLFALPELKDINTKITNSKYTNSQIYNSIDKEKPSHIIFFKKLVSAYENFISFLRNDDIIIDYTYLWDIITMPNKKLFPNGINLVILDMVNNDITENVNIICPTNAYSTSLFDINKYTLILIRNDGYFEPIYTLEDKKTNYKLTRLFNLKDALPELKNTLRVIKTSIVENCAPISSMPNTYKFKRNIVAQRAHNILINNKYEIFFQILNFNGKVIGFVAEKNGIRGFIPAFPSNKIDDIPEKMMDDDDIWNNYSETLAFLNMVYDDTKERIACKPKIKVIEDKLIVGILTNANQFVALSEPELNIYKDKLDSGIDKKDSERDDLEEIDNSSFIQADKNISTSDDKDYKRIKVICNIKIDVKVVRIIYYFYIH